MKNVLFIITFVISITDIEAQSVTSIEPDSAYNNQLIDPVITATSLFFQTSSPSGDINQIYIKQGTYVSYLFDINNFWLYNINVVNDTAFIFDYTVPSNAPLGLYDVYVVDPAWNTYILPSSFTIIPPNGYAQGFVYNDLDSSGTFTIGEPGIPSTQLKINPGNYTFVTDSFGTFNYPLFNGNYTISKLDDPMNFHYISTPSSGLHNFTISNNNATGLDFGLRYKLKSISPNYGHQNSIQSGYITSEGLFNVLPTQAYLKHDASSNTINLDNPSISGVNFLNFNATIGTKPTGLYSLYIRIGSIWHQLPKCFTVLPPDGYISGIVYYDINGNGIKDTNDTISIQAAELLLFPPLISSFTNTLGLYTYGVANGSYTIDYIPKPNFIPTSPVSQNVFINNNSYGNINFGTQVNPAFDSIYTTFTSGIQRCNTVVTHYLKATNHSGHAINGRLYFIKSSNMPFVSSSPVPDYNMNDTLYWNFSNLNTFDTYAVSLDLQMPGQFITISQTIIAYSYDSLQNVIASSQKDKTSLISCSYDPNDKKVTPLGVGLQNYTLFGEELIYKIRFQNTGNDTAFNIYVYDTLDASLDLSTFQFIASSHNATVELNSSNNALKFSFKNIRLPDSVVNEPLSHGFIEYSIRCLPGLVANTIVDNTAYIVFDLNPAIVTNTVSNTMVYVIPLAIQSYDDATEQNIVFPNPVNDNFTLKLLNENSIHRNVEIFNSNGSKIFERQFNSNEMIISFGEFANGVYTFIISNEENNKVSKGIFIKQ